MPKGPKFLRSAGILISIEEQYFGYKEVKAMSASRQTSCYNSYSLVPLIIRLTCSPQHCRDWLFTAILQKHSWSSSNFFLKTLHREEEEEGGRVVVPPCGGGVVAPPCGGGGRRGEGWSHRVEEEGGEVVQHL